MDNIFSLTARLLEFSGKQDSDNSLFDELSDILIEEMAGEYPLSINKVMDFAENSLLNKVKTGTRKIVIDFLDSTTIYKDKIQKKLGNNTALKLESILSNHNIILEQDQKQRVENLCDFLYLFKQAQSDKSPSFCYKMLIPILYYPDAISGFKYLGETLKTSESEILTVRALSKKGKLKLTASYKDHFDDESLENARLLDDILNNLTKERDTTSEELRADWIKNIQKLRKSMSAYSSFEKWTIKNITKILTQAKTSNEKKISNRTIYRIVLDLILPFYPALHSEAEFLSIKTSKSLYSEYLDNSLRAFLE